MNRQTVDALWNQAQQMSLFLGGKPARLMGRTNKRGPSLVLKADESIGLTLTWDEFSIGIVSGKGRFE